MVKRRPAAQNNSAQDLSNFGLDGPVSNSPGFMGLVFLREKEGLTADGKYDRGLRCKHRRTVAVQSGKITSMVAYHAFSYAEFL